MNHGPAGSHHQPPVIQLVSLDRRMQQERENIEACAQRSQFVGSIG
jgi:hypothetical protein